MIYEENFLTVILIIWQLSRSHKQSKEQFSLFLTQIMSYCQKVFKWVEKLMGFILVTDSDARKTLKIIFHIMIYQIIFYFFNMITVLVFDTKIYADYNTNHSQNFWELKIAKTPINLNFPDSEKGVLSRNESFWSTTGGWL